MKDSIINWLLEEDNPSVRFFTLTSLMGKSSEDQEIKRARKNIMEHGVAPKILEKQNDDGSWGDPDRFYRDKYRGSAWTLLLLAEMAAAPEDKRVKKACEFMLRSSQDPDSGGFSFDRSAKTGTGIPAGLFRA